MSYVPSPYEVGLEAGKVYTAEVDGVKYVASPAEPNGLFDRPHFYVGPEYVSQFYEGAYAISSEQAARWMCALADEWTEVEKQ